MNWLQQQITNTQQPDTILHLGSGLCSELDVWRQSGARRIILVEPNPELLPELQQAEHQHAGVEIIAAAVAAESGRKALKLFNFPLLNSLREPTGLYAILPGLAEIGQVTVDVLTPEKLVETTDLQTENINWLVIDTLGEEAAIISALEQNQLLNYFDRIIIQAGAESLYDGAGPAEQITRQLEQLGYDIEGAEDTTDRDWPRYHLRLNPSAIECRRLRRENEALIEQKGVLEKQNEELAEQLQQKDEQAKKRAGELETAQKQAEQQRKELTAKNVALKERFEELEKAREQAEQQTREVENQIEGLNSRLKKLAEEKTALENQNKELTEQLEQQKGEGQKRAEELQGKLEKSRQQAEKQTRELEAQISDLKAAKDHYERLTNEQAHQLEERQKQQAELDERQRLLDTEMQRAEAQIDLIKDVLIREKNF